MNAVKVAVLFADYGIGADYGNTFPFAIYEGGQEASAIQAAITDGAFITEITESGKWTRMFKVNSEGGGSTAEQIVAGSSGSPLDAPSAYVGWNPTEIRLFLRSPIRRRVFLNRKTYAAIQGHKRIHREVFFGWFRGGSGIRYPEG